MYLCKTAQDHLMSISSVPLMDKCGGELKCVAVI